MCEGKALQEQTLFWWWHNSGHVTPRISPPGILEAAHKLLLVGNFDLLGHHTGAVPFLNADAADQCLMDEDCSAYIIDLMTDEVNPLGILCKLVLGRL